jgi:hypothetical protein
MDLGLLELSGPMNSILSDTQKSVLHVDTLSQSPIKIPPPSSPVHKISLNYDMDDEQEAEELLQANLQFTNHTLDEPSIPFASEGDMPTQTQSRWEDTQVAASIDPKLPYLGLEDEDVQQLEKQIMELKERDSPEMSDHRGPLDDFDDPLTDGLDKSLMDISVEIVSEMSRRTTREPVMPILIVSQDSVAPEKADDSKEAVLSTPVTNGGENTTSVVADVEPEPIQEANIEMEDTSMLFEEQGSKDDLLQVENENPEILLENEVESSQEIIGSRSAVPISESDSDDEDCKEAPLSPNLMEVTKISEQNGTNPFLSITNGQIVSDSQGGVAYDPSQSEMLVLQLDTDPLCIEPNQSMEKSKRSIQQVESEHNEENRHPNLPVSPQQSSKSHEAERPAKRHRPSFAGNDSDSSSTEPDNSNDDDYQPTQNARLSTGKGKGPKVSRTPKTTPKTKPKKTGKRFYWIRVPEKEYMIPYELPDGVLEIDLG